MVKFLIMSLILMFTLNYMSFYLIQIILQNLLLFLVFYYIVNYPMSIKYWVHIYYNMGYDIYSMGLILLSFWIMSLMIMMSLNNFMSLSYKYYFIVMIFMLMFLVLCFLSMNLILFYLFFESSLIPVFMLILGWGVQVDRIQASFYMILYTLLGSMPLFFFIIYFYKINYVLMMGMVEFNEINMYMYIMMILAFLIKMPMYFVHLWLPKAHVEAPLVGSMILAGVMLKLGSYGLLRVMLMMKNMCMSFNKFVIIISLMGGIYSSLICLCQVDMKMLVAYSSVVHMSMLMSGMMTLFSWGYMGGILMMLAHGLCSSGLFCLVNINYDRLSSRSLFINKGLINLLPSLSLMWFLLCSSNLSFPPSLNLWSEIMLLNSLVLWDSSLIILLMMILMFGASYSLYLYSFSQHGVLSGLNYSLKSVLVNEFMVLLMHWVPLNLMCVYMHIYS